MFQTTINSRENFKIIHILMFFKNSLMNVNSNHIKRVLLSVATTYKKMSPLFHDYYTKSLKSTLLSESLFNKHSTEIDERLFNTFIDNCMVYRLGLTDKYPKTSDIMYDISNNVSMDVMEVSLDTVLDQLLYSAVPQWLVSEFKQRLESQDVDDRFIEHITFKLNAIPKN